MFSESRAVVSAVLVVSDVSVSPSPVVTECFDDVSFDPDWEFVESQFSSFSKKRPFVGTVFQEIMRYEGTPVQRLRTPGETPQQSSHSAYEEWRWQAEMEVQESFWTAGERMVIANWKDIWDNSEELRVEFRELDDVHLDGGKQEVQQKIRDK